MITKKIEEGVRLILAGLEVDPRDQNFEDTPARYARALAQMFNGQNRETWSDFEETYNDLILLRGHEIYSLCPHHLLPVRMSVNLAYIPNGRVIGLSKLVRVLHEVNRGPVLQEKFTYQGLELLLQLTGARSGACLVAGEHGCMRLRGVKTSGDVITTTYRGDFEQEARQTQFLRLIGMNGHGGRS